MVRASQGFGSESARRRLHRVWPRESGPTAGSQRNLGVITILFPGIFVRRIRAACQKSGKLTTERLGESPILTRPGDFDCRDFSRRSIRVQSIMQSEYSRGSTLHRLRQQDHSATEPSPRTDPSKLALESSRQRGQSLRHRLAALVLLRHSDDLPRRSSILQRHVAERRREPL